MLSLLPEDLVRLLSVESRRKIVDDRLKTGHLVFHAPADLRVGTLYVAPRGTKDPNRRRKGIYRIPAISLVKSCENHEPHHLVTYLPFEGSYAVWDSDHALLSSFSSATWADIAKNPEPYINALWESKPRVPVLRSIEPWQRYEFLKNAFY